MDVRDDRDCPSEFAPAERASAEDLARQGKIFGQISLLDKILEALPNIVVVLNRQRQIIFANRLLLEILGLESPEPIIGLRPGEAVGCVNAKKNPGGCGTSKFCSQCGAVRAILESFQNGRKAAEECRITRHKREGWESLDFLVWSTPFDHQGERFTVFALNDVSAHQRRRALERIFFHDVLNLAGGLRGLSFLLKDAPSDNLPTLSRTLREVTDKLMAEISAQKDLARAESGELSVEAAPINALDFLKVLIGAYQGEEAAKGVELRLAKDASAVEFVSDPILLGRVVGNMIKNALEASSPGEAVTAGCRVRNGRVEFWVHNPAVMPPEAKLQVFQRSFSTKGQGRGLGTYSMRLLSEDYLKGKVDFTSEPEKGTTFFAAYPLTLKPRTPRPAAG